MKLLIKDTMSIRDLQFAFNSLFPFLKLEFFRNGTILEKMYALDKLLPKNSTIGEIWKKKEAAEIEFTDTTKVKDLENVFMDKFGLTIQIFRKSGNLWLETTMTDNWTLKQQNEHGKEITTGKPKEENKDDFDLNRDQPD
jgi:glycerol-3-phosphate O-acyltransferase